MLVRELRLGLKSIRLFVSTLINLTLFLKENYQCSMLKAPLNINDVIFIFVIICEILTDLKMNLILPGDMNSWTVRRTYLHMQCICINLVNVIPSSL